MTITALLSGAPLAKVVKAQGAARKGARTAIPKAPPPECRLASAGRIAGFKQGSSISRGAIRPNPRMGSPARALFDAGLGEIPALEAGNVRIHFHRPGGDYAGWGLHTWGDAVVETAWEAALPPTGECSFGLYWDVPVDEKVGGEAGFLFHKGEEKDVEGAVRVPEAGAGTPRCVWVVSGRSEVNTEWVDPSKIPSGNVEQAAAHWLAPDIIAWRGAPASFPSRPVAYSLHTDFDCNLEVTAAGVRWDPHPIPLTVDPRGLPVDILAKSPYLEGCTVLRVPPDAASRARTFVKAQLALSATVDDGEGGRRVVGAAGMQIARLIDHEFSYNGPLGAHFTRDFVELSVWAPTAHQVNLLLYREARGDAAFETRPMYEGGDGVWRADGDLAGLYYQYEVKAFHPQTCRLETMTATDPYSRALSANGERSLIVDLGNRALTPEGWAHFIKPPLEHFSDVSLYELHVRDFSATDGTVPEHLRGKYLAFECESSDGMQHLSALARAGLTHVHLLPTYDFGSVPELKEHQQEPAGNLSAMGRASEGPQEAVMQVADRDAYNWGYDPVHYGVPEGSYATNPDGAARVLEYRSMVQAINRAGLRVVADVVYNHTQASGPHAWYSVLDKIVPGYYHRRAETGEVEASTCANNTASEHYMMSRLIVDDLVHWAKTYRVDGFRFDLMGHVMLDTMAKARRALSQLTVEADGVDGKSIYLYGEGWEFGEVHGGQRGRTACQVNLAGTGVGSFNDRFREACNGGSPFGDPRLQGWATGLALAPKTGLDQGTAVQQEGTMRWFGDMLQLGMAGNLRSYPLLLKDGDIKTGGEVDFGSNCPLAYAGEPWETVNYVSAHDNETLFDTVVLKSAHTGIDSVCRINHLATSLVVLAQGVPFIHAGDDLLRSKSLDRDSYNSGDWFNRLDWSGKTNNFGVGLPPAGKNREKYPMLRPLLEDVSLDPGADRIARARDHLREMLAVRYSSPLFRLRTAQDVRERVTFHNGGPGAEVGVIVMQVRDGGSGAVGDLPQLCSAFSSVVIVINARPGDVALPAPPGMAQLDLHPALDASSDELLGDCYHSTVDGLLHVTGRTAAVFVSTR